MKLEWLRVGRVLYLHVADDMGPIASMMHDGEQYRDGDGLPLGPSYKVATKAVEDKARKAARL